MSDLTEQIISMAENKPALGNEADQNFKNKSVESKIFMDMKKNLIKKDFQQQVNKLCIIYFFNNFCLQK